MVNYTGTWNWDTKSQGMLFDGSDAQAVDRYRAQAEGRVESYAQLLKDLEQQFGFKIDVIGPTVKTEQSSLRKVWDRNAKNAYGQPENIIDYLRATIVVPEGPAGIKNLRQAMETLISHPLTVAYKDQFWKPEPDTGYRSFKALLNVDGHTAELKVDYGGMKEANDLTEHLRAYERRLKDAEMEIPRRCGDKLDVVGRGAHKLSSKMEEMIHTVRDFRKQCHDLHASECGLDALRNPEMNSEKSLLMTDFVKSVKKALHDNPFGRGLQPFLSKITANDQDARPLRPS